MWLRFYLYEFKLLYSPKKIKIKSALIVCNSLLSLFAAAAVKQFCDSRNEKKVSSAPIHWSLCVLWCERAAVRGAGGGGEWRQRRGISRGMHILVYSQQLHLGEQRGAWPPLRSEPGIFSPSLWKQKKHVMIRCDSLYLPQILPCIFVANHSFDVRREDAWLQGPVWHRALVLDNGAQRALALGSAGGQRNRQIKEVRCWGCHLGASTHTRRRRWNQALPSFKADGIFLNVSGLIFGMQPLAGPG